MSFHCGEEAQAPKRDSAPFPVMAAERHKASGRQARAARHGHSEDLTRLTSPHKKKKNFVYYFGAADSGNELLNQS
jgi:hypothetical protein